MRATAGWDAERAEKLLSWPLRDLLLAYLDLLKQEALRRYEHDVQVWAALAPHEKHPSRPPKPPRILRG